MDNLFDLDHQNLHLSEKIAAGLERLATLSRSLLWQESQAQKVSPVQFQMLAFLSGHAHLPVTLTLLARELGVTKATLSEALKSLEQKGLVGRAVHESDGRVRHLALTAKGRAVVQQSAGYLAPIVQAIGEQPAGELVIAWKVIASCIRTLMEQQIITPQRMCFSCRHYSCNGQEHYCALLKLVLHDAQIRLDCPEHDPTLPAV